MVCLCGPTGWGAGDFGEYQPPLLVYERKILHPHIIKIVPSAVCGKMLLESIIYNNKNKEFKKLLAAKRLIDHSKFRHFHTRENECL